MNKKNIENLQTQLEKTYNQKDNPNYVRIQNLSKQHEDCVKNYDNLVKNRNDFMAELSEMDLDEFRLNYLKNVYQKEIIQIES